MDVRTEPSNSSCTSVEFADSWAVGPDIQGLKVGRFSLHDFDIEVIDPVIVDRLDFSRVDILETFLVTKSMLVLADISQPFSIIQWYCGSKLWPDSKTKLCCEIVIITIWQCSKIVISNFWTFKKSQFEKFFLKNTWSFLRRFVFSVSRIIPFFRL